MNQTLRVLVSAAGSGPAVALIKYLKHKGFHTFSCDIKASAVGNKLSDVHFQVPVAYENDYIPKIRKICKDFHIDLFIPVSDQEQQAFDYTDDFLWKNEYQSTVIARQPQGTILNCNNKKMAYDLCFANKINQPKTFKIKNNEHMPLHRDYPIVAKPICGVGSRDHFMIHSLQELRCFEARINHRLDNYIVQQYVEGDEYSLDTFAFPHSGFNGPVIVPRLRERVRDGQMAEGRTVYDKDIIDFGKLVIRKFKTYNVCCIQVIKDKDGKLYFIENNPRYGTGISLSLKAGVNFPLLQWKDAMEYEINKLELDWTRGLLMQRYWEEKYELPEYGS